MSALVGIKGELWLVDAGTGTPMTKEACEVVSGTTYHVTDPEKRYYDPAASILVYDDDVLQTTGYHIEGGCHIVFGSAPSGDVTVTADYLTPAETTLVQNWNMSLDHELYENKGLGSASRTYQGSGLIGWSGTFERFAEDDTFFALLTAGTEIIVRLFENQPSGYCWTGWARFGSWSRNNPMELATESLAFTGEGVPVYTTDET